MHLHAGGEYTRLVLRNPGSDGFSIAKGGMLVYISAPALLGTIEAHPMSVALRGAPPCLWNTVYEEEGVFTLCESSGCVFLVCYAEFFSHLFDPSVTQILDMGWCVLGSVAESLLSVYARWIVFRLFWVKPLLSRAVTNMPKYLQLQEV